MSIFLKDPILPTQLLEVETHIKPTNRQAFVHAKSYHPQALAKVWLSER